MIVGPPLKRRWACNCGSLNELFEAQFKALALSPSILAMLRLEALWTDILPVEPATLQDVATQILASTQEVYTGPPDLGRTAAFASSRLASCDVTTFWPCSPSPNIRHIISRARWYAGLQTCLREMGLSPAVDGRLEWRERSAHFGPPAALALHIPDEIVLSYAQVQGLKGTEALAECQRTCLAVGVHLPRPSAYQSRPRRSRAARKQRTVVGGAHG